MHISLFQKKNNIKRSLSIPSMTDSCNNSGTYIFCHCRWVVVRQPNRRTWRMIIMTMSMTNQQIELTSDVWHQQFRQISHGHKLCMKHVLLDSSELIWFALLWMYSRFWADLSQNELTSLRTFYQVFGPRLSKLKILINFFCRTPNMKTHQSFWRKPQTPNLFMIGSRNASAPHRTFDITKLLIIAPLVNLLFNQKLSLVHVKY